MECYQEDRIRELCSAFAQLTDAQMVLVETAVRELQKPFVSAWHLQTSDVIDDCMLCTFGDALRIHHCYSYESFTKDKFEYALEWAARLCGKDAALAPRGNPGHDLSLNGQMLSLKTQADAGIAVATIHISKFMELGKGQWSDRLEHLKGLQQQFLRHLEGYERIFTLRCLSRQPKHGRWRYELVEIPKDLLAEARDGVLEVMASSRQNPKPGNCHVYDDAGLEAFRLYFDGGGERKLQIRHLRKDLCIVHAEWVFSIGSPSKTQLELPIG